MPYRHAHWWLIALFPIILVAFWPNYFSQVRTASIAYHAHGLTATAWLVLVAVQSWSIATRRMALHRSAGLALFGLVPLFAAGGALALQGVVGLYVAKATPFHAAYGVRLVASDLVAAPTFVVLVALALLWRRNVRAHAAAMLSTVLLVLPPVLGRLLPALPGFPADGAFGLRGFELAFHMANAVSVIVPLYLARRDRAGRAPFLIVAAATSTQMVLFETLGRSALGGGRPSAAGRAVGRPGTDRRCCGSAAAVARVAGAPASRRDHSGGRTGLTPTASRPFPARG